MTIQNFYFLFHFFLFLFIYNFCKPTSDTSVVWGVIFNAGWHASVSNFHCLGLMVHAAAFIVFFSFAFNRKLFLTCCTCKRSKFEIVTDRAYDCFAISKKLHSKQELSMPSSLQCRSYHNNFSSYLDYKIFKIKFLHMRITWV